MKTYTVTVEDLDKAIEAEKANATVGMSMIMHSKICLVAQTIRRYNPLANIEVGFFMGCRIDANDYKLSENAADLISIFDKVRDGNYDGIQAILPQEITLHETF